jgi:hypothetical protein
VDLGAVYLKKIEEYFELTFEGVLNPEIKRVWILVLLAKEGAYSRFWYDFFLGLGVLHILVFSGSQIGHISRTIQTIYSVLPGFTFRQLVVVKTLYYLTQIGILLSVGCFLEWPAPATRAILFELTCLAVPLGTQVFRSLICFTAHILLFESHVGTLSWVLSWGVWVFSGLVADRMRPIYANTLTSVTVWILLGLYKGQDIIALLKAIPLVICANFLLGYLFEKVVFKLGGILWVCIVLAVVGDIAWGGTWGWDWVCKIFVPFLESATGLLLVALHGFGYIKRVL